jgi:hypothetical protein
MPARAPPCRGPCLSPYCSPAGHPPPPILRTHARACAPTPWALPPSPPAQDVHLFDTTTHTWSEVAAGFGLPRWGHSACSVEAIPNWKVFVFGGYTGDLSQTAPTAGASIQGTFQQAWRRARACPTP